MIEGLLHAFGYVKSAVIAKANPVGKLVVPFWGGGLMLSPPMKYDEYSEQGYKLNAICRAAIDKVAKTCSKIPIKLQRKNAEGDYEDVDGKEDQEHPLMQLMLKPNPRQRYKQYVNALIGYQLISGNTYQMRNSLSPASETKELWLARPDRMRCIPGDDGLVDKWIYTSALGSKPFDMRVPEGQPAPISHWAQFNPLDEWYGLSPLGSAAMQVCQHNEAARWNAKAIKNGMRPDGVFTYKQGEMDATLTEDQRTALKDEIKRKISGAEGAHEALILDGGFEWTEMQIAPKDLDWLEGSRDAARIICLIFGCPPILLNIPGDNTYKNYEEARGALHEDTCIPLMQEVVDDWNEWVVPQFGEDLHLALDLDKVPALDFRRNEKWDRVSNCTFMTTNEKRKALDMEPDPNKAADAILVPSNLVPLTDEAIEEAKINENAAQGLDPDGNPLPPEEGEDGEEEEGDEKKPAVAGKPKGKPAPFSKACLEIEALCDTLKAYKPDAPRHANGSFHSIERAAALAIEAANTAAGNGGDSRTMEATYRPRRIELSGASAEEIADAHHDAARAHISAASRAANPEAAKAHTDAAAQHAAAAAMQRKKASTVIVAKAEPKAPVERMYEATYDSEGRFKGIVSKPVNGSVH